MLRIQSGIAYQTSPSGRPDENDSSATDAVRHDPIARTSAANPLGRFSAGRVSTAVAMAIWYDGCRSSFARPDERSNVRTTNGSDSRILPRASSFTAMHSYRRDSRDGTRSRSAPQLIAGVIPLAAEDWPEWRGRSRAGVWNESGVIDTFPSGGLTAGWRTPIHAGYAGPAVAGGRVFVTDSRRIKANQAIERAVALDEQSGRILWTHEWETNYSGLQLVYAIGPRATPTVDEDRVYVLGAMGRLFALDVKSGRVLWEKDYVADFNASVPTWGMAGAPLVDGDLLICLVGAEPDGKVIALDKRTGKEIWRALSSNTEPGYNQPIIINAGGARQLILFHPEGFSALDPATGKVFWEIEHRVQMGIVVATPVHSGRYLFFTSQHGGARMLALDEHKPCRGNPVERPGGTGSGNDARYARHGELGDRHTGHRWRVRVRAWTMTASCDA